jgi:hypothetical protein
MRQLQLQCAKCDAVLPHNQQTPNHVVHALVSLFLVGLWIPIWIVIALGSGKEPAACVKCGNRRLPTGPATIAAPAQPATASSKRTNLIILGVCVAGLAAAIIAGAVSGALG